MADEITKTQRTTQAYWFIDGIAELVGGFILAVVGAFMFASTRGNSELFSQAGLFAMIIGFPLSSAAVRKAKDKITHERTGYVKYPERSRKRSGFVLVVAAVLGAGFAAYAVATGDYTFSGLLGTAMIIALGVSMTISLAVRARRLELPRFYITAAVVALATIVSLALSQSFIGGMGIIWMSLGVASILTGSTVFAEYMTQHPQPESEAEVAEGEPS